jgi:hypothetical protein
MPSTLPNGTSTSRGKFELPVLAPLDSLTAGTNIPPPPDSPIEEKPLELAPKPEPEVVSAVAGGPIVSPANGHANGANGTTEYTGRGRTNETSVPTSPVSMTRPSSIRRFLSRKSLYSNYSNGTDGNRSQENLSPEGGRPESPSAFSTVSRPGGKRRSSSWFRRFVGGGETETKRTSIVYEEKEKEALKGPPPPTLPELDQLKAKVIADDAGSLGGGDMFKNIH